MKRHVQRALLTTSIVTLLFPCLVRADSVPERIQVSAQLSKPTCFLGQQVDLIVGVVGVRERPEVAAPTIEGVEVFLAGTNMVPVTTSAIGDRVFEQNLYRTQFRLVPRKAGKISIPAIGTRLGDRTGASRPLILQVKPHPSTGRPSTFLGGVGAFDVEAAIESTTVRAGQTVEYQITIRGPGALGVHDAPSLDRLSELPIDLQVHFLRDRVVANPPSHGFDFQLRPRKAGTAVLPPIAITALDPITSRYVTKVTPGIPIRVSEVAQLDPSDVRFQGPSFDHPSVESKIQLWVMGAVPVLVATLAALAVENIRRRGENERAARLALRRVINRMERATTESETGLAIADGIVAYLQATVGRQRGALTPGEARDGVALATGNENLAKRAERLVARSDRARFAVNRLDFDPELPVEARGLLVALLENLTRTRSRET